MRIPPQLAERILLRLQQIVRSQEWLAQQASVSLSQLRRALRGERDVPLEWIERVAQILGISTHLPIPPAMQLMINSRLAGRAQRDERTQSWLAEQIGIPRSTLTHAMRGTAELPLAPWLRIVELLELPMAFSVSEATTEIPAALRLIDEALRVMPVEQRALLYRNLARHLREQGQRQIAVQLQQLLNPPEQTFG